MSRLINDRSDSTIQGDAIDIVLSGSTCGRIEIFAKHDSIEDMANSAFRFGNPLELIDQRWGTADGWQMVVLHIQDVQWKKVDFTTLTSSVEFFHQTRGDHVGINNVIIQSSERTRRDEGTDEGILPIASNHFDSGVERWIALEILDQCPVIPIDDLWITVLIRKLTEKPLESIGTRRRTLEEKLSLRETRNDQLYFVHDRSKGVLAFA